MEVEENWDLVEALNSEFLEELKRARAKFPPMKSRHEGYGIIKEEFDEFWEAIMTNQLNSRLEEETIQLGAMVLAFLSEVIYDSSISTKKPHCYGKPNEMCSSEHEETDEDCEYLDECMKIFQEEFKKPDFDDTGLDGCKAGESIRK